MRSSRRTGRLRLLPRTGGPACHPERNHLLRRHARRSRRADARTHRSPTPAPTLTLAYVRHCTHERRAAGGARGERALRSCSSGAPSGSAPARRYPRRRQPVDRRRACAGWPSARTPTSSCSARTTGPRPGMSLRSSRRSALLEGGPRPRWRSRRPATTTSGHRGSTGSACSRSRRRRDDRTPPASLADSFDATLTRDERQIDLLVVGSRLEARRRPA